MKFKTWFYKLPSGLRVHRLLQTIWAELTFPQGYAPGHFYSPIPDRTDVIRDASRIFTQDCARLPEIDLHEASQLALLTRLSRHPIPFLSGSYTGRFRAQNDYLPAADAITLFAILMEARPARYIEIGSGFSSALVLDVRDQFLNGGLHCTFIEPDSSRLEPLLRAGDKQSALLVRKRVQDVEDEFFSQLNAGDILFVDSSHVSKVGSDLNDVLFRILPLLKPGVVVHFHDVYWPFEYGRDDVLRGRSWNEAYVLRAFLANNTSYRIYLFGSWLEKCHSNEWFAAFPQARGSLASSLWIVKEPAA